MDLGGRVFIRFILMRGDLMELVPGGYHGPRVCGGLLARISQTRALA
jgi:hypothetical protein